MRLRRARSNRITALALSGAVFDCGPVIEWKLFFDRLRRGHYRAEGRPNRGRSLRGPQLSGWQLFLLWWSLSVSKRPLTGPSRALTSRVAPSISRKPACRFYRLKFITPWPTLFPPTMHRRATSVCLLIDRREWESSFLAGGVPCELVWWKRWIKGRISLRD